MNESANEPAAVASATKTSRPDIAVDFGHLTKHRLPWGVFGVIVWMLLFAVGVLVPAEPSRKVLGWKSESDVKAAASTLEARVAALETKDQGPETQPAPQAAPAPEENQKVKKKKEKTPGKFQSFVIATFTFTPINVGILCILAAFIGGCSINKNEIRRIQQAILDLEAEPPVPPNPELVRLRQRLDYLTEHPGYSTIRGLVVYVIIISGLFIIGVPLTGENGSQSITLAQYMKLAGLFSFFGYLSGYDPTVFSSVIGIGTKHLNPTKPPHP